MARFRRCTYDYHTMSERRTFGRVDSELWSEDLAGRFLESAEGGQARGLYVLTARFRGRVGVVGRDRGHDLSQLGHALGGAA